MQPNYKSLQFDESCKLAVQTGTGTCNHKTMRGHGGHCHQVGAVRALSDLCPTWIKQTYLNSSLT